MKLLSFTDFNHRPKFRFEGEFEVEIPKNEKAITYARYMANITEALSELYHIEKERLETLFSKTLEEIKTERLLTRDMLAYA